MYEDITRMYYPDFITQTYMFVRVCVCVCVCVCVLYTSMQCARAWKFA
jgi:hypothetical protein